MRVMREKFIVMRVKYRRIYCYAREFIVTREMREKRFYV